MSLSCYRAVVAIETLTPMPDGSTPEAGPIVASWLGRMDYRAALELQKRLVAERAEGRIGDQLLLLEHPRGPDPRPHRRPGPRPRRPGRARRARHRGHPRRARRRGHLPRPRPARGLPDHRAVDRAGLLVRPLVRALEAALVATCAALGVAPARRDGHPGCWCDPDGADPRKIGALGLRIERGVSYHGIALNVTVDLADFDLIDPCGMPGVTSTSIAAERGETAATPTTRSVERAAAIFAAAFAAELGAPLAGI